MVSKMNFTKIGTALKLLMCAVIAFGIAIVPGIKSARADGGLELSTTYPGITVKSGTDAIFSLKVSNKTGAPQNVAVSIESIPNGWTYSLTGQGNPITRVYVENDATAGITFTATIPADAAEDTYPITLKATSIDTGITDTLKLEVKISKQDVKSGTFTTQYPAIQGPSTATYQFSTNLTNNSGEDQMYSLSSNAPTGWKVIFKPAYQDQEIASLSVPSGGSQTISVTITPVYNVTKGEYTINCAAVSAKDTLSVDLVVGITGTYELFLTSENEVLNADAYAGNETAVNLIVKNNGTADISNVQVVASAPTNWNVRFEPSEIGTLAAGDTKSVTAYIKPANNAIAGDYVVSFAAASAEAQSQSSFRVTVKTSTLWGIVGIAIILILVAGLIVVFMKFGRR